MKTSRQTAVFAAILLILTLCAAGWGTIWLTPWEMLQYAWSCVAYPDSIGNIKQDVVQFIRLPHLILSFLIGSGLAVCGAVMQAVMRNPLADPYLLGISSGASLGAVLAIVFGVSSFWGLDGVGAFAAMGAGLVSILILFASRLLGRGDSLTLLLLGFSLNAVCGAAVSFIVSAMAEPQKTRSVQFWMMGNITISSWATVGGLALVMSIGILYFFSQRRILDLMLIGDELSLSMGWDLSVYRKWYIAASALMIGTTVYVAGMIGFVGLLVPHAARLVSGSAHCRVIPISTLAGGCFLSWADILGRNMMEGMTFPIGVTVALVGSPFFLWLLCKKKYSGGKV